MNSGLEKNSDNRTIKIRIISITFKYMFQTTKSTHKKTLNDKTHTKTMKMKEAKEQK